MLIFLDTEFNDFVRPDLISIALVSEDGREFYAERTDYRQDDCSEFVRQTVQPLLGRVPGAKCDRAELARRLCKWFDQLPEPAIVVYDFESDWALLVDAYSGSYRQRPHAKLVENLHLDINAITHPAFERAQSDFYTQDWPAHHALADARALMAGYRAWLEAVPFS